MKEKVMDVLCLMLMDAFNNESLENNVLSNVCEEHDLIVSDVFPSLQLMTSRMTLIRYVFYGTAKNDIERYILDEVKNQIKEYITEREDLENELIQYFIECYSGDVRSFLELNDIAKLINEL